MFRAAHPGMSLTADALPVAHAAVVLPELRVQAVLDTPVAADELQQDSGIHRSAVVM